MQHDNRIIIPLTVITIHRIRSTRIDPVQSTRRAHQNTGRTRRSCMGMLLIRQKGMIQICTGIEAVRIRPGKSRGPRPSAPTGLSSLMGVLDYDG